MTIALSKLQEPLHISEIEFRIREINKGGYMSLLAYKDARVDINRLNKVCGVLGWKREHSRDNANCTVSIWDEQNKHWVGKEDTGTESNTEAAKGLASDSFKRACFNLGIGIELYDYPDITIKLKENEFYLNEKNKDRYGNPRPTPTWELKLKAWLWYSEFDENGKLSFLAAKDDKNEVRFQWGTRNKSKN
jgi:hypothetical protein